MNIDMTNHVSISPTGYIFLACLIICVGLFVLFRKRMGRRAQLTTFCLLLLVIGFTAGVLVDEFALARLGILSRYDAPRMVPYLDPHCPNC